MKRIDIKYREPIKLDRKDLVILEQLYEDGRMLISDISRKTSLKRDSVIHRIKKMFKQDVISFIRPLLNPPALGYPLMNHITIEVQNYDLEIENKFLAYLRENPFVTYIAQLTGRWDYAIQITCKNPEHFAEIMKEIKSGFSNFIKSYEVSTIIKEPKYEEMLGIVEANVKGN